MKIRLLVLALAVCGALLTPALAQKTPSWTLTKGHLMIPRTDHTATLLKDGRVLIVTGSTASPPGTVHDITAELYNPDTETFAPGGDTQLCHGEGATATRLLDGCDGCVLIVGGVCSGDQAEIYDPHDPHDNKFHTVGPVTIHNRVFHTATLLPNGKVLIAGGVSQDSTSESLDSAELFDPATEQFTETGRLNTRRLYHSATLLADERGVLIVGGNHRTQGVDENCERSAEIYDLNEGKFHPAEDMNDPRCYLRQSQAPRLQKCFQLAIELALGPQARGDGADDNVLIAGGQSSPRFGVLPSAELFERKAFHRTGDMNDARFNHTLTVLPSGKVLVAGGGGGPPREETRRSAEIYDPDSRTFARTADMKHRRQQHTATLLFNGKVLVVGGLDSTVCPNGGIADCTTLDTPESAELFSEQVP